MLLLANLAAKYRYRNSQVKKLGLSSTFPQTRLKHVHRASSYFETEGPL